MDILGGLAGRNYNPVDYIPKVRIYKFKIIRIRPFRRTNNRRDSSNRWINNNEY